MLTRRRIDPITQLVGRGILEAVAPTTDSGWRRYPDGMRETMPAATNTVENPSFEYATWLSGVASKWILYDTLAETLLCEQTSGRLGGSAQRMSYTAGTESGAYAMLYTGPSAVATYPAASYATLSGYLKGSASTGVLVRLKVMCYQSDQTTLTQVLPSSDFQSQLSDTWQRFSVTVELPALTSCARAALYVEGVDTGNSFDITIDDVNMICSPVLEPYFDGRYPDCAWSSTAHYSPSTRTGSVCLISGVTPVIPTSGGVTVAFRCLPHFYATSGRVERLHYFADAANVRLYFYKDASHRWSATFRDAEATPNTIGVSSAAGSWEANTMHHLVCRAQAGGSIDLNHDGTNVTPVSAASVLSTDLAIVQVTSGSGASPVRYGPLIISPSLKSDTWRDAIQADYGAAYSDVSRLVEEFMVSGDRIAPFAGSSGLYRKVV